MKAFLAPRGVVRWFLQELGSRADTVKKRTYRGSLTDTRPQHTEKGDSNYPTQAPLRGGKGLDTPDITLELEPS